MQPTIHSLGNASESALNRANLHQPEAITQSVHRPTSFEEGQKRHHRLSVQFSTHAPIARCRVDTLPSFPGAVFGLRRACHEICHRQ